MRGAYNTDKESGVRFGEKVLIFKDDSPLNGFGHDNFAQRKDILDADNKILTNGTLSSIVSIKPSAEYYCQTQQQAYYWTR